MSYYIIQNPLHGYAVEFIKRIHARFGYTPICIFTNLRGRYYYERQYPILAELAPDTRFDSTREGLPALAARLREKYTSIVGIVPFSEDSLDDAPRLIELFGLDWNPPALIARFREKNAFKTHIARKNHAIRLNRHFIVRGPADLETDLPARFVLKPNDGAGSVGVGVFRRETPKPELARFLAGQAGKTFILEEFVDGLLHTIDGLVDERGEIHIAAVFTSARTSANGSDVVYGDGWLIHQNNPIFGELSRYARQVMTASELRRSPFHMEVIVDAQGPCLVEVAARLIGSGGAFTCSDVHRNRFNFFDAAAHAYLSPRPYGELGFDWDYYNSIQAMELAGISYKAGLVVRTGGVEAVERLPEFKRWHSKPKAGQWIQPTTNLGNGSYGLLLIGKGTLAELRTVGETVHRMIKLDVEGPFLSKLRLHLARGLRLVRLRLGWSAFRALSALKRKIFSEPII
jgi:hypothetical protein